jgi:S1-C subfamily serine protease
VNVLDVALLGTALATAVGGYRLGLLARALSWAGMLVGLLLAVRAVPVLVERLDGTAPTTGLLVVLAVLVAAAFAGQGLGLALGARAHLSLPAAGRPLDRMAGGVAGLLGLVVVLWLLLPAVADLPGAGSRLARGSVVARAIEDLTPRPPDTLDALRRLVGEHRYPEVFSALRRSPDVGPPPVASGLPPVVVAGVAASTVRVQGESCGRVQEGSGFVAEAGFVVTNAHVVAGQDRTQVVGADDRRRAAEVVAFDPARDLALLAVPDLAAPPLATGEVAEGGTGAVFGHPGGGALRMSPFALEERVEAVGRDLYDEADTQRRVLVLAADLAPGDSGAAVVDTDGGVVGVAFAIAPDEPGTAYALDLDELAAILAAPRTAGAGTGPCLPS